MNSPQAEKRPLHGHKPVLDKFIQQLVGAINRSPLLKVQISKTGRLLDCQRFEVVEPYLSDDVLQAVIDGAEPIAVQLDLRAFDQQKMQGESGDQLFSEHEGEEQINVKVGQDHARIFKALNG